MEQIITGKDEKDYFIRTNGSTISSDMQYNNQTGYFFGAQDFRYFSGFNTNFFATINITDIDIAGFNNLQFKVDLAEDDNGTSWEEDDYIFFKYDIYSTAGPTPTNATSQLLDIRWDATNSSEGYLAIDTNSNGTGDGTRITPTFSTFTSNKISGTGDKLIITIEIRTDNSEEDIAIDNIEIWGDPIPGFCTGGTTTWDGANWSHGIPDLTNDVIINGDFDTDPSGSISACNLTVLSGHTFTISNDGTVVVENDVIVESNAKLIIESGSALVQHNDTGLVENNGEMILYRDTAPMDA
ncbi:hypothetical protein KO493_03895 [Tamlana agarivorans]|uniref:Uncharacterized protein n=1 Tax=Pseudotamlana agarivorans TaxID=481183 RepID=A0ACC5U696_9FLAO|nr:hypothetical protein [Tamlana agarivorans]MBU2949836.1 hypothetical protein [Tamlana agarivorans]